VVLIILVTYIFHHKSFQLNSNKNSVVVSNFFAPALFSFKNRSFIFLSFIFIGFEVAEMCGSSVESVC
jgi:hypothetical protein